MNEQFTKLAIQAAGKGFETFATSDFDSQEKIQKFAELIVRECIGVIGDENYTMLTGKAYCTQLKRHFGVQE